MNFYFSCLFLIILFYLEKIKCESEEDEQQFPDLITNIKEDGNEFQLEAYRWNQNDGILYKNNTKNYAKLKWFSLGHPIIVLMNSNVHSKQDRLFHHSSNGIFTHIQLLTFEHKKLLANKVKELYNIEIQLDQIMNMPLTAVCCEMNLQDTESELTIKGEVKSFNHFPLKLDFKLAKNSKEMELFNKSLARNENDFELKCKIESKIGYSNVVYINSIKHSSISNICTNSCYDIKKSTIEINDQTASIFNHSKQHSQKLDEFILKNDQFYLEIKDQINSQINQTRQEVIQVLNELKSLINDNKREMKNECDKTAILIKSKTFKILTLHFYTHKILT